MSRGGSQDELPGFKSQLNTRINLSSPSVSLWENEIVIVSTLCLVRIYLDNKCKS